MYWRFGEPEGDGQVPPLLFDDCGHWLRYREGPWVSVPQNPARILGLLLRMQHAGRTVTAAQIGACLRVPPGTRVSGHVSELKKKIAEAGADPERVIQKLGGAEGYKLAQDIDVKQVVQADELRVIAEMMATPASDDRRLRLALGSLYQMLLGGSVALSVVLFGWLAFRDAGGTPIARLDPNPNDPENEHWRRSDAGTRRRDPHARDGGAPERAAPRTLVPDPSVHAFVTPSGAGSIAADGHGHVITLRRDAATAGRVDACFPLAKEVELPERSVLALEVLAVAPCSHLALELTLERERAEDGRARVPIDVRSGRATLRIPASALDARARGGVRRICIGASGAAGSGGAACVLKLREIRLE